MGVTEAPVSRLMPSHVLRRRSSPRADTNSSTPSLASASAVPRPSPALPPLMIALRPRIPRSMSRSMIRDSRKQFSHLLDWLRDALAEYDPSGLRGHPRTRMHSSQRTDTPASGPAVWRGMDQQ